MIQKIGFIVNENLYKSKHHFTYKFAEALKRQGLSTFVIDIEKGNFSSKDAARIRAQSPNLTCSFNTILPLADGNFLWDILQTPHLSILLDPVIYSMNLTKSPFSVISCVDRFDCDIVRSANFSNHFFFPHAVEKELVEESLQEDRPYDVVLLGSCYDHESLRTTWQKQFSKPICDAIEYAIDIVLTEPKTTFVQAILRAWNTFSLSPQNMDFIPIFTYVDHYVRGKDRYDLLRSLKGVNIHVFGSIFWEDNSKLRSWSHYLDDEKNITVHPPVAYEEALQILKKSKICLNSTPFFKNGSHERLFAGLATGCAVLSSENIFVRENFSPDEGVELYQHKQLEGANEAVQCYLGNESYRKEAVMRGRKKVATDHTWDQRAQQLTSEMSPILGRIFANTINPN